MSTYVINVLLRLLKKATLHQEDLLSAITRMWQRSLCERDTNVNLTHCSVTIYTIQRAPFSLGLLMSQNSARKIFTLSSAKCLPWPLHRYITCVSMTNLTSFLGCSCWLLRHNVSRYYSIIKNKLFVVLNPLKNTVARLQTVTWWWSHLHIRQLPEFIFVEFLLRFLLFLKLMIYMNKKLRGFKFTEIYTA